MPSQTQSPDFSIIVPAYNATHTLAPCIHALQHQTNVPGDYEIIIVDNGSTDDTVALAQRSGVQVIHQQKRGPASARNMGIQAAKGNIVCFTDADCEPQPTWLSEIVAPLLANLEIAGCKGAYCCRQTELFARFVQLDYEDKYDILQSHEYIAFMDFYSASYRRDILLAIGKFNEQFTAANSEDRELSYRLASAGHKMVFQRSAVVCHLHTDNFKDYVTKKMRNGYWTVLAVRHFSARMKDDSYTPQVQKVQIGLMAIILATTAVSPLYPPLFTITAALLFLFFLTTLPFARKAWHKDRQIALLSPFLLALRALMLGIGFTWGWLRPLSAQSTDA